MDWEESKTIQHGSCTIIIRRPKLTKKERVKREDILRASVESAMREYIRRKETAYVNKHTSGTIREKQI